MLNKTSNIELGGRTLSPSKYLQRQPQPPAPALISTHQIPGKVSPSKHRPNLNYTAHTSRQPSTLTSENSFVELKDSAFRPPHPPLRDASNLASSPRHAINTPCQLVRVNFVSNSPNCSRTSSTHVRELQPAAKMVGVERSSEAREALERKLKVLEGRIGELHREKHELAGRLNEENRKVYHENTALKLKLSELTKRIERQQTPTVNTHPAIQQEADTLRTEVARLEEIIENITEKCESLAEECNQAHVQLQESKSICQQLQAQKQDLTGALRRREEECQSLQEQLTAHQQEFTAQQQQLLAAEQNHQKELQQIQSALAENTHRNAQIAQQYEERLEQEAQKLQQYETKLAEYQAAYDTNQQVIEQLSQQLALAYAQQEYPHQDEVQESEGELALECKNLENNFLSALDERDQQVALLQASNHHLEGLNEQLEGKLQEMERQLDEMGSLLAGKEEEALQLGAQAGEQAARLEEVGGLLQRYTGRMREMEDRYSSLQQELEAQRAKGSLAEKCKKCEELTRTIFRLNSHLNKRN